MEIIKAGLDDYDIINDLVIKVWPQTYKDILSQEQITYMLDMMYSKKAFTEQISLKNHHYIIIKEDKKYLGFASYELNYHYETTKIHKIYVLPETQGRGAGRLMVNKIAEIALKNSNNILSLNVNRYNKAVHFYEKTGFIKSGEEDINIGNGYLMEDYIMEKKL